MNSLRDCASCGTPLQGRWCHVCGEKAIEPGDLTVSRYVRDLTSKAFDADSRVYRTVRTLVFEPGRLTAEYLAGRRKSYMSPVGLFLLMNILFFVVQPFVNINTFNSTLHAQTHWYPYSDWAQGLVDASVAKTGLEFSEYQRLFDVSSERLAKTLIFIQVPLLACCVLLLRLPRPGDCFRHLIFLTHTYALILLINVILSLGVALFWALGGSSFDFELPMLLVFIAYFSLSMRGAYGDGWIAALLRGVGLMVMLTGVLFVYRVLLLLFTMRSIELV